jgi:biopolymer transport protein ExbD
MEDRMAMATNGTGGLHGDINVTSFIDVLLVLLVIFMLSVEVRRVLHAQMALERAASGAIAHPIVLELRDDGSYALNRQTIPFQELAGRLHVVFQGRDESVLFVKAGPRRTYREMIQAMDIARGAGVEVLAIAP